MVPRNASGLIRSQRSVIASSAKVDVVSDLGDLHPKVVRTVQTLEKATPPTPVKAAKESARSRERRPENMRTRYPQAPVVNAE